MKSYLKHLELLNHIHSPSSNSATSLAEKLSKAVSSLMVENIFFIFKTNRQKVIYDV